MDALLSGIQWLANFFGEAPSGITYLLTQFFSWAIQKFTVFWISMQVEAIKFGWGVAKDILSDLQVSQRIMEYLGMLPAPVREAISFFRGPECIANLLTAHVTRFVMRFIPG